MRCPRHDRVRKDAQGGEDALGARAQASSPAGGNAFASRDGWRLSDADGLPYAGVEPAIADGPMPSPSAVLLDATLHVADHFDDDALRARARTTLLADDAGLRPAAFFHATRIRTLLRWRLDEAHRD